MAAHRDSLCAGGRRGRRWKVDKPSALPPIPTMPNTMPTLCMERVWRLGTSAGEIGSKRLAGKNVSQLATTAMPIAKSLILLVILVRDQEVGGSNPLAPTNPFNHFQIGVEPGPAPIRGGEPDHSKLLN